MRLSRHFATVGDRVVHYTRAGTGPVVLLLHESPCSAKSMAVPQSVFAERFTTIAPDTPGFGLSDALPSPQPEITDFADALVGLLDVLGIEQAAIYGRHTGASIATAFAQRHPERCAMLLTAGLPVYSTAQQESRLTDYLKPLQPSWDGTHLLWLWFRYRDQHVFWPWHDQRGEKRADRDVPDLDFLQRGVLEFLEAGDAYRVAYAAAFRHGGQVLDILPRLRVPACLAAHEGDSLFRTLPLFSSESWTVALPRDEIAASAMERDLLSKHPARGTAPPAPSPAERRGRVRLDMLTIDGAQTLVRSAGPEGPETPILVLHHVPGSSALYDEALLAFGLERRVVALDLPGCGESAPGTVAIDAWATHVARALDHLGLSRVHVYGHGGGAAVAVALAGQVPNRIASLLLDGPAAFSPEQRQTLIEGGAPSLQPVWDGSHLISLWHHLRDQELWFPWHVRTRATARSGEPEIDPISLNRRARECLKQPATYAPAWHAVATYPLLDRLAVVTLPIRVLAADDDLFGHLAPAAAAVAGTSVHRVPSKWSGRGEAIMMLLP